MKMRQIVFAVLVCVALCGHHAASQEPVKEEDTSDKLDTERVESLIKELGDGWIGIGGYFHEIKADIGGLFNRFVGQHNAQILAVLVNHAHFGGLNEISKAWAIHRRCRGAAGHWGTYSCISCH